MGKSNINHSGYGSRNNPYNLFEDAYAAAQNGDVTFENVKLEFAHRYHDAVFANGHKLVLNNVSCESCGSQPKRFGSGKEKGDCCNQSKSNSEKW